jgi:hypothetical protein
VIGRHVRKSNSFIGKTFWTCYDFYVRVENNKITELTEFKLFRLVWHKIKMIFSPIVETPVIINMFF